MLSPSAIEKFQSLEYFERNEIRKCKRKFSHYPYLKYFVVEDDHDETGDVERAHTAPDDEVRIVKSANHRLRLGQAFIENCRHFETAR